MSELEFSPAAQKDLKEIAAYIRRDNVGRALSFVDELEQSCAFIADFPSSGRQRPELGEGLRSKPHGNYLIFYSADTTIVRIERILHGSRDLDQVFGGG